MELEGETTVEGPSVDRLIGLQNVRTTLALMRTPDGHGRIELDKFHTPAAIRTGPEKAPVNELGIRRIMLSVDDIDEMAVPAGPRCRTGWRSGAIRRHESACLHPRVRSGPR